MSAGKKKLLHLQGIRGVAILTVVAFHFFPKWCKNGYLGVDIFFLLSGYLMTMMLDRVDNLYLPELAGFWYRRMKRIVPLYYLATLGIIGILFLSDGNIRTANVDSALHALFLATNLIRPTGMDGYFEKLGVAVDMFTHTWSLALEMQFYLIFPFIFLVLKFLPKRVAPCFVFTTGTAAFYAETWFSPKEAVSEEKQSLIESIELPEAQQPSSSEKVLMNTFVMALLSLLLIPEVINPLYARMNSILIAFIIVAYGRNCCLENRFLVFIGEVSYGWYLVHWPVYATMKTYKLTEDYYLFCGIIFSLLLATIIYYSYERFYLTWSKFVIFNVVIFLLACNGAGLAYLKSTTEIQGFALKPAAENKVNPDQLRGLDTNYFYPSDFMDNVTYGFENMTAEERITLNTNYDSADGSLSHSYCKKYIKTNNTREMRCFLNEHVNKTANATILIIGNSWVGNLMQTVDEACSPRFSNIVTVWESGCNPLFPSDQNDSWECNKDYMFLDAIKEFQPEVVMMLVRYSWDAPILVNGTTPVNDWRYKEAARRLKIWQQYVKKRIIIADTLPWPHRNIVSTMIQKLKGEDIKTLLSYDMDDRYFIMKQRIARIAAKCEKCVVMDFGTQFWFNGEFKYYEPNYFVSFMTSPLHLTPAGWVRVKPLLKFMCETA